MINIVQWMSLSKEVREKLINTLGIKKSGSVQVRDNVCVSDGVTQDDLKDVTLNIGELDKSSLELGISPLEGQFKCQVCGKICKNRIGLAGHSRSHNIIK